MLHHSAKAYPTVDLQDAKFITTLGNVCSTIERLPASAVLSAELEECGTTAVASGGFTDIWRGKYHNAPAAIKTFRAYPPKNLKEAKKVSIQSASEVHSRTEFTDPVGAGADVEKTIS